MEIKNITNLKDLKKGEFFKRVSKKGIGQAVRLMNVINMMILIHLLV